MVNPSLLLVFMSILWTFSILLTTGYFYNSVLITADYMFSAWTNWVSDSSSLCLVGLTFASELWKSETLMDVMRCPVLYSSCCFCSSIFLWCNNIWNTHMWAYLSHSSHCIYLATISRSLSKPMKHFKLNFGHDILMSPY